MFMNKISMSQTCLHNISHQKATRFSQQPVATEGIQYNTNFATVHSQVTVDGCSVEYKHKLMRQFTMTVGGTRCSLWLKQSQSNSLQGHTKLFCLQSYWVYVFRVSSRVSAIATVLFRDMSKKASYGPAVSCSGSV